MSDAIRTDHTPDARQRHQLKKAGNYTRIVLRIIAGRSTGDSNAQLFADFIAEFLHLFLDICTRTQNTCVCRKHVIFSDLSIIIITIVIRSTLLSHYNKLTDKNKKLALGRRVRGTRIHLDLGVLWIESKSRFK